MCARVTSTYMDFTFTFGPKLEFKNTFKCSEQLQNVYGMMHTTKEQMFGNNGQLCIFVLY